MSGIERIRDRLLSMQDEDYRDFCAGLMPTIDRENIIGIRTPALRAYAKELTKDENAELRTDFLQTLPHKYYEENNLHGFLIEKIKDFNEAVEAVDIFLPYIDNWATCDTCSPKVFKKYPAKLLPYIENWLNSGKTYVIRFGIGMLMSNYLDEFFDRFQFKNHSNDSLGEFPDYGSEDAYELSENSEAGCSILERVASVRSEEYYVKMMIAWFFATALAKQYESTLPYIEERRLDVWTHNKTIQKAVESMRISYEQKEYLKTFRISGKK